jgi:aspartate racemase
MTRASRTVGVLGGMGPAATVDFLRRIVEATQARCDQEHVRVLVDSDPRVPDRTAFLLGVGTDPRPALIRMARGLEHGGAELLVMPCNTAHAFADDIAAAVSIPLVDWPGVVADAVAASRVSRAGLLATSGTVVAGIYQRALGSRGVEVVTPGEAEQEMLMAAIYGEEGIKVVGPDSRPARELVAERARRLVARGADGVVLGCTELSALHGARPLEPGVPVFDAADIVARHVVTLAGANVAEPGSMRSRDVESP